MSPKDERLIADLDEATSRLRASLKTCRKILDTYRPKLAPPAADAPAEPPLFDWPRAGSEPPPRDEGEEP